MSKADNGILRLPGFLAFLLLFCNSLFSQGTDFKISATAFYDQGYPVVLYNSVNNEFFVLWQSHSGGPSTLWNDSKIIAQRISNTGSLQGTNIDVTQGRIASDVCAEYIPTTNHYLVYYFSVGNLGGMYLQKVRANGTITSQDYFQVLSSNYKYLDPSIAYNAAADQCLLVWRQVPQGSSVYTSGQIYGVRLSKHGNPIGTPFLISTSAGGVDFYAWPKVEASTRSNNYLVTWVRDWTVWGQRITAATGALQGANFTVNQTGMACQVPELVYNSVNDEYLVAWKEHPLDHNISIYGRRVGAASGLLGPKFAIVSSYIADKLINTRVFNVGYNADGQIFARSTLNVNFSAATVPSREERSRSMIPTALFRTPRFFPNKSGSIIRPIRKSTSLSGPPSVRRAIGACTAISCRGVTRQRPISSRATSTGAIRRTRTPCSPV